MSATISIREILGPDARHPNGEHYCPNGVPDLWNPKDVVKIEKQDNHTILFTTQGNYQIYDKDNVLHDALVKAHVKEK